MKRFFAYTITGMGILLSLLLLRFCHSPATKEGVTSKLHNENTSPSSITSTYVNAPFATIKIPFHTYYVTAGIWDTIVHPSSTRIIFPPCAFKNDSLHIKNGKVEVQYREFMDPTQILISGIPMKVSENGDEYLESGGMMEIYAYQEGTPLQVNPQCRIQLVMNSTAAEDNYNLYYLDTNRRKWDEKIKNLPVKIKTFTKMAAKKVFGKKYPAPDFHRLATDAKYFLPEKPIKANPNRYSFHFKIDLSKYPHLNVYDGIQWEYAGKDKTMDPEENAWVKTAVWEEMSIEETDRKGMFLLKLNTKARSFTTLVRPVFEAEDMEYAMDVYNDKYRQYREFVDKKKEEHRQWEAKQKAILEEQERQKRVALTTDKITRTFEIDRMGIWNVDRLLKEENVETIIASFRSKQQEKVKIQKVFLIMRNVNTVISYYPDKDGVIKELKYMPDKSPYLIAIDTSAAMYVVNTKDLQTTAGSDKGRVFLLENAQSVTSVADVRKAMEKI